MIFAIFLIILAFCTIYQSLALNRIEKLIQSTKQIEREIQYKMALDFAVITTAVQNEETVEAGVETTLAAISQEIKDLAANQQDPADQQKLNDFATRITNSTTALSTAIATVPTGAPAPSSTATTPPTV